MIYIVLINNELYYERTWEEFETEEAARNFAASYEEEEGYTTKILAV